ncbi:FAD binding domain-containing protein [Megamonas rupellensis]|uniref:FAD binding domain-containing protein n=1 Tax=Megamonas rupellensis TaxID=491921 RepID=UPI00241D21F3|nr:FAD binding domain-containing protein [Megamonas rupellensis]
MLTIKEFRKVSSIEEAYELNQKKTNRIIGGMLWLKMQTGNVNIAIDLSGLNLNTIEETDTEFKIGAMTTLRDLELHAGLNQYTNNSMKEAMRHIVGVQFRNLATVGGSIYGRYGFSDVLTVFMALDAYVELHHAGIIPISEFAKMPYDNDVLVNIIVKKTALNCAYLSHRQTKTDFPVLAVAVSKLHDKWQAVIGATPHRAVIIADKKNILGEKVSPETIEAFANYVKDNVKTDSNIRGSAQYRKHLAYVLVKRALVSIGGNA